jgi:CBS-domain-containing membrane protein
MDQDTSKSQDEELSTHSAVDTQQSTIGEQSIPPQKPVNKKHPYGRIDREHPIGGEMSDIVGGLFTRLRMPWLLQHHTRVYVLALFSFINGCISIGIMSALALITHTPFIFPSLGPTAFLFFYTPTAPAASPHNTIIGHAIGIFAGYFSLVVTGLTLAGPALTVGVTWSRVIAAALSLGLTSGLMVLLKSPHPPAGATTLIISLGLLTKPWQLVVLMLAVVLLTLQALAINRLAGIPYPLWGPIQEGDAGVSKAPPN